MKTKTLGLRSFTEQELATQQERAKTSVVAMIKEHINSALNELNQFAISRRIQQTIDKFIEDEVRRELLAPSPKKKSIADIARAEAARAARRWLKDHTDRFQVLESQIDEYRAVYDETFHDALLNLVEERAKKDARAAVRLWD